jgi:hypothetical protein
LGEQILDAAAREWPYGIDNLNELKQLVAISNDNELQSTLEGLYREAKIRFQHPPQSGQFVLLEITPIGRQGREKLACYNAKLAAQILAQASSYWPDPILRIGELKGLVNACEITDDDEWLKALLALELTGLVEFENPIRTPMHRLRGFVGLRATTRGRDVGQQFQQADNPFWI